MLSLLLCLPFALARPQNHGFFLQSPLYNKTGVEFTIPHNEHLPLRQPRAVGQSGSVSAKPENPFRDASFPDAIFVETVELGTPPRKVALQMDTGSWQL